jgi:hypothetical protein
MADTSNRGLGSPNMSDKTKHKIQSEGGKASPQSGDTKAAKKGGENSSRS